MSTINWNNFKGEYVKFETPGMVVEGTVTRLSIGNYKGKDYPEIVVETSEGSRTISANQASLKRRLADDPPAIGEHLHVEYLGEGEAKAGQNPIKNFRVVVTHGNTGPKVEDLAGAAAPATSAPAATSGPRAEDLA
jgi:hypothetical protein